MINMVDCIYFLYIAEFCRGVPYKMTFRTWLVYNDSCSIDPYAGKKKIKSIGSNDSSRFYTKIID